MTIRELKNLLEKFEDNLDVYIQIQEPYQDDAEELVGIASFVELNEDGEAVVIS